MYDTSDTHDPPTEDAELPRYRTVEFSDGLVIYDRTNTERWIHADESIPLDEMY